MIAKPQQKESRGHGGTQSEKQLRLIVSLRALDGLGLPR